MPAQTPSQTVGPFFSYCLTPDGAVARIAGDDTPGTRIRIAGRMLDGAGAAVSDGMVEIWQADAAGMHANDPGAFSGFGRVATDAGGRFEFETVKPGAVAPGAAPHLSLAVFARGMLNHAFTRIYFSDEEAANAADPVLAAVPASRRATLIAERRAGAGIRTYDFTIRLQGDGETVLFDA